jgi:hypothetical protein
LLGLWLIVAGRGMRRRRGLGGGKTVSLDKVTLTSHRLGLTGRPDRLIKTGGTIIPCLLHGLSAELVTTFGGAVRVAVGVRVTPELRLGGGAALERLSSTS